MGLETRRRSQDGNGDLSGSGDGARTGMDTGVETCRRTQDGSGNRNGGGDP